MPFTQNVTDKIKHRLPNIGCSTCSLLHSNLIGKIKHLPSALHCSVLCQGVSLLQVMYFSQEVHVVGGGFVQQPFQIGVIDVCHQKILINELINCTQSMFNFINWYELSRLLIANMPLNWNTENVVELKWIVWWLHSFIEQGVAENNTELFILVKSSKSKQCHT